MRQTDFWEMVYLVSLFRGTDSVIAKERADAACEAHDEKFKADYVKQHDPESADE